MIVSFSCMSTFLSWLLVFSFLKHILFQSIYVQKYFEIQYSILNIFVSMSYDAKRVNDKWKQNKAKNWSSKGNKYISFFSMKGHLCLLWTDCTEAKWSIHLSNNICTILTLCLLPPASPFQTFSFIIYNWHCN